MRPKKRSASHAVAALALALCALAVVSTAATENKQPYEIKSATRPITQPHTIEPTTQHITPTNPPKPQTQTKRSESSPQTPKRECDPGCERIGTCDPTLGRCDCPPFMTGPNCSQPLFPDCVSQHGMRPPHAPCGIPIQPSFPVTCACLLQCHSLGLDARQECIVEREPGLSMEESFQKMRKAMPWMPMIANETLLARTRADATRSMSEGLCSNRGIFTVQLPYNFNPPNAPEQHTPVCRCFPGYTGSNCEIEFEKVRSLHKCVHDCSGHGECFRNWCHCQPGYWGIDCSINEAALSARHADSSAPRPRIYIYEMPPRFTSWMGTFRKGDWTHDHWYGADVIMHHELLKSPHRTLDPEEADFFFIPVYLSLGYYTHRYYFKHFTNTAAVVLRAALQYVNETWPYFGRNGGKDHILVFSQDQGNRFVRSLVPQSKNIIHIHHWGAPSQVQVDDSPIGDHIVGHDITTPPFHEGQAKMNRWFPPSSQELAPLRPATMQTSAQDLNFSRVLFFSGKMNFNWGRHYSLGVRQAVYRAHKADPNFLVMAFDNGVQEKLPLEVHVQNYATSKFCLAPAGYGFSSRQYECVFVGCVPVIIQDDVEMAFEEVLPWKRFSVRVNFSDVPLLPQILAAIPKESVASMRRGLGCIWPRMLWLAPRLYTQRTPGGEPMMERGRPFDAFSTTMWTLRRRLKLPDPPTWRAVIDSCLMEKGDDDESKLDIEKIRASVRARYSSRMSESAQQMDEIIAEWAATGGREADKIYSEKTRFFPTGERPPGFEGKWLP